MHMYYFTLGGATSADRILINGLRENGVQITEIPINGSGVKRYIKIASVVLNVKKIHKNAVYIIGYRAGIIAPVLRAIDWNSPVIYLALASLYEGMIISQEAGKPGSLIALKYWLIDWASFSCSSLILVESLAQSDTMPRFFHIRSEKFIVHRTGADDKIFRPVATRSKNFTVLFRGKFTPEAGVDVLLKAAKRLESTPIHFRILGHGFLKDQILSLNKELRNAHVEIITEYLPDHLLIQLMNECHLALGQLSKHPRLDVTIPFKSYESMALGLPYLTARNKAIMEIFTENENCLCFTPGDPNDLAEQILYAYEHQSLLESVARQGYEHFQREFAPKVIAAKLLGKLNKLVHV